MGKPRVSIITSVFKSESFIEHFLHDVARQSIFPQCELILLNAQSPENEEKYILEFQKVFPDNVIYKKLDKRYNVYETWNMGVDIASADLLTNWNTDDRRTFYSLGLQAETMESDPSLDVCYGPTLTTFVANEFVENCTNNTGFGCYDVTYETLIQNNSPHCLPMWRKDIHKRFGYFDAKYFSAGDYEMWLRVLAGGGKFKKINALIGSYYRNPTGISSNLETIDRAVAEVKEIQSKYARVT